MSEIIFPEYHEEGMGCGLEDQHITNRYEACRYGFEQAIDACYAEVIEPLENQLEASRQECERLREFVKAYGEYRDECSKIDKHVSGLNLDALYLQLTTKSEGGEK